MASAVDGRVGSIARWDSLGVSLTGSDRDRRADVAYALAELAEQRERVSAPILLRITA
jgi:hypothetical protein